MSGSFVERAITVVITAGTGNLKPVGFGPNHTNTMTLAGYRVSAEIVWPGGTALPECQCTVYGMNLSDMNAISSIGQMTKAYAMNKNTLSILAGDAVNGMSLVFQGILQDAIIDFDGAPQVGFVMTAYGGYDIAMIPVPPSSFRGSASVVNIMQSLATQGALGFENNGVTGVLSNPYFPGTIGDQIKACARDAGINFLIDTTKGTNGVLAIWPKFGYRAGTPPTISPQTGMKGYPNYTANGVDLEMLFNPTLRFGGRITVQSSLQPACGTWNIYSLYHSIESITPGGDWFTTAQCWSNANFAAQS